MWSPVDNLHPQRGHTRPVLQPGRFLLGHVPQLSHKPSLQAGRFQSRPAALTLCKCQVNSCLCVATSSSAFSECCGIFFFSKHFPPSAGGGTHRYRGPTLHGIGPKKEFRVPSHEGKDLTAQQEAGKGYGRDHLEDESRRASDHAAGAPARWGRRRVPSDRRMCKRVREGGGARSAGVRSPRCLPPASPPPYRGNLHRESGALAFFELLLHVYVPQRVMNLPVELALSMVGHHLSREDRNHAFIPGEHSAHPACPRLLLGSLHERLSSFLKRPRPPGEGAFLLTWEGPGTVLGDPRTPSPRSLGLACSSLQVSQQFLAVPCTELFHIWFSH